MQALPAEYPLHAAIHECGEGPSDIGKNGACRAETSVGLLRRGDPVIHLLDFGEVARCVVQISCREAWHRTGTGDDRHTSLTRRAIKRPDVTDEGAGIGQVAVMSARSDCRFGDGIALVLKRTHCVNDQPRAKRRKGLSKITAYVQRCRLSRIGPTKAASKGLGLGQRASGNDQRYRRIALQGTRDIAAEVTVASEE